jgi:putative hydroxymethylpyrimidine transport system substrate-binding protein
MQAMAKRRLLLLLPLLAAAACGGGGSPPGDAGPVPVTLALDWYPNPDHAGIYAAIDRGVFARAGLRVTPRPPSDVSDPIKLVATGRADLGVSYEPELFFAQEHGIPVTAVATVAPEALASIIASGKNGITTPADLRGRTIGIDGTPSTTAFVDTVLESSGVDPRSVHLTDVGFNQVPALLAGRVDAVAGVFRNVEGIELAQRGADPVVFPVDRFGVPAYDELVVIADPARLRSDAAYRSMTRRFVGALARATTWARAHPAAATAIMRRHSASDYRGILERSVPATLRLLAVEPPPVAAWARFGAWMQRRGLLDHRPDAAALVDLTAWSR